MANVGQDSAYAALFWMDQLFNNGTISFYSGTMPSTPETAVNTASNTLISTWTFGATAFSAPSFSGGAQTAAATFTASSVSPVNSANVSFARAIPPAWGGSVGYSRGSGVTNGGNVYQCTVAGTSAASGGPTGTTNSIVDNTVTWQYVGPGPALIDYTVGTTGTDIIVGTVTVVTGTTISLSLTHKVVAV